MSDATWPPALVWPDHALSDGVVALDRLRRSDEDRVVYGCTDAESQRWLPLPNPYGVAEARAFIESRDKAASEGAELTFAVRGAVDGILAGLIGLSFRGYRSSADIGYWTAPDRRGRGWTARAVRLLAVHALTALPLRRVEILADVENTMSRRVAEGAGMTFEGVRRRGLPVPDDGDAAVYSLIPDDLEDGTP